MFVEDKLQEKCDNSISKDNSETIMILVEQKDYSEVVSENEE